MSIRRMSLGEGYRYLLSSVARADGAGPSTSNLTRYYAESGTPPGWFIGAGLADLADGAGVARGSQVTEEHLFRMLGMLQDPITGRPLGRRPSAVSKTVDGTTRRPVAGLDLTFSVPKSVSVIWALADSATQRAIYDAHVAALKFTIDYAETAVFSSRTGKDGVLQEPVRGIVGAAFDHWDSRSGDPQLHTHVAVLNRVQTADGTWRTLDSRALFKATVTLSALYNGVLSDYLTAALGFGWEPTTRGAEKRAQWEIVGVPTALREEFSQRSTQIDVIATTLAQQMVETRGRPLTERERLQIRQQATLMSRPDKQHLSLQELTESSRRRAARYIGESPAAWVSTLRDRNDLPLLRAGDLDDVILTDAATIAVQNVAGSRATYSRANVLAEVLRHLHGVRFASPADRVAVAERTTLLALERSLLISPPELAHTPARFQRADGTSRFRAVGAELYTSRDLLDAEQRLLDAGRSTTAPAIPARVAEHTAAADLSPEQANAVGQIITSRRRVDVLVGAAGTGKTRTMGVLRETWETAFGEDSVLGLAPSATAAQLLADELGIPTENTAKWLTETARQPARLAQLDQLRALQNQRRSLTGRLHIQHRIDRLHADIERWRLHPSQIVIIDEASLAGTLELDAVAQQATEVGAKILLVGDWAQLSAVTAGGAFGMLVRDRADAPELAEVRRFTEAWERAASTALRRGEPAAAREYADHGRIVDGDRDTVLDKLFHAWEHDTAQGRNSVMIAADNHTVTELNDRARADRVARGLVTSVGVTTAKGSRIGVGDRVVTRRNDRALAYRHGWVKNGDEWAVTATRSDGSITIRRVDGAGRVRLPATYVAEHLDLAYAMSAHRAQGRTTDTAHAYITAATGRELLYVMATRGREGNQLYVDTAYDPDPETLHGSVDHRTALDVLDTVLANGGSDTSATETLRSEWNEHHSIRRLWAEYETIAAAERDATYTPLLAASGLSSERLAAIRGSDSYGALLSAMRGAEARGLDLAIGIADLIDRHALTDADDPAAVLQHRVEQWLTRHPDRDNDSRISGLFPQAVGVTNPDTRRALDERLALIENRANQLAVLAAERQQPWAAQLGTPPYDPYRHRLWMRQLAVIAAYRERWGIHDRTVIGPQPETTEQLQQQHLARAAARRALALQGPGHLRTAHEGSMTRHHGKELDR